MDKLIPFLEDKVYGNPREIFKSKADLRVFKSHQPFNCDIYPCKGNVVDRQSKQQCTCPNCARKFRRVIYVYRNGKDTLASYWRFRKGLGHIKQKSKFNVFANKYRMYPGVNWADHIRSWLYAEEANPDLDILWLSYENLRKEPLLQTKRIADFLNLEVDSDTLHFAVEASSKEVMQAMEQRLGGISFFMKRYKKGTSTLKFVGSEKKHQDSTSALWGQLQEKGKNSMDTWNKQNMHVMTCLGYA